MNLFEQGVHFNSLIYIEKEMGAFAILANNGRQQ